MTDLRGRAEDGDVDAQYRLGVLHRSERYHANRGGSLPADAYYGFLPENVGDLWVPPDDEASRHWLRRAAEQGHAPAQVQLAGLLSKKEDALGDPLMAYVWFSRAADRMDRKRQAEVRSLRARVAGDLTAYQRDEARRLVREWSPRAER